MEHWFSKHLEAYGDAVALIWHDRPVSFRQLCDKALLWKTRLEELHIGAGDCVAIEGDFSPGACSLLLALLEGRQVAVPLPGRGNVLQENLLDLACVRDVISPNHEDGWQWRLRISECSHPLLDRLRSAGEPGLLLFSSGSAGESKASAWSLDRLLEKYKQPRKSLVTLSFLKLDHIGGLNTLFHALASGGTAVVVEDRDADTVCRAIELHRVQLLPTTPTFLKMLLISDAQRRYDLSSLELITYGTEPMPDSTLAELHASLPGVKLKQTYGLTELGILPTCSKAPGSPWMRLGGPGFETKVVSGVLWVRAQSAMLGYLNAPSPFDADGWFNTQDAVIEDGNWLRILGRVSDIINVGGEKIYPAEVESVLLEVENIKAAAVHGRPSPVTGQIVAAAVSVHRPEDPAQVRRRVHDYCKERLAPYQVPVLVEVTEGSLHGDRYKTMRWRESARRVA